MRTKITRETLGAALYYMALFGVVGIMLPFFPVFLAGRSLDETQIATVLAAPLAIRIVFSAAAGAIADRLPDHRYALLLFSVLSLFSFALLATADSYSSILVVTVLFALFWTALVPVIDTITLGISRQSGADYGQIRLWGSVAFIFTNLAAGYWLQGRPGEAVYQSLVVGLVFVALAAFLVPAGSKPVRESRVIAGGKTAIFHLSRLPGFMALLVAASLIQASHAMIYGFGTIYWEQLGLPRWQIGALWAIGVVAEIFLFAFAARIVKRLGPVNLIGLGALVSIARWILFPFLDGFAGFLILQVTHGLTFGATYLGTVHYISRHAPSEMAARAQTLYATIGGLCMAVAMITTGLLFREWFGGGFAAMAVFPVISLFLLAMVNRKSPN